MHGPNGTRASAVASQVFNCTYAKLNALLSASGIPLVPLKHELTEMALVEPPPVLASAAVTVMCGPFFSCMPFPPRGLHTLSHVRYTPHLQWHDRTADGYRDGDGVRTDYAEGSAFPRMVRDATRYLPDLARTRYRGSLWEIKTVLPRSETDDSRPILVHRDPEWPGLHCVIGGKIDNVYDLLESPEVLAPEVVS